MEKIQQPQQNTTHANPVSTINDCPQINLSAAKNTWGRNFSSATDLFSTTTDLPTGPVVIPTHMVGKKEEGLRFIAYNDHLGHKQTHISNHISPDDIAISIKHHSPKPYSDPKEKLKFQCTHIQLAVGVSNGAITINNPQSYTNGLFGDADYPMIFIKPKFPEEIPVNLQNLYKNNIRTWAVIANMFTNFPGDYNGRDPLKCTTKSEILNLGKILIQALLGDENAKNWLRQPEQLVYCAELAYLSLNLGLYFPLSPSALGTDFEKVKRALASKEFLQGHDNPHITLVSLNTSSDALKPIDEVTQLPQIDGNFWNGLAIQPFHSADIVAEYIQRSIPRKELGENVGSKMQAAILKNLRPALGEMLELTDASAMQALNVLLDKTIATVEKPHASYQEFRAALKPLLTELAEFSKAHGMAYIPPHCFLLRATDNIALGKSTGVLSWEYLGHGIHENILY